MKKVYSFLAAVLITISIFAQVPQKLSYQAVIRNSSNQLVVNQAVGMRISILQGASDGTAVYVETQTPTTNANGLLSLEIGGGTPVTGTFESIDWSTGVYFIKTETDPSGGTNYTITGTSQLLSVPYALLAEDLGGSIKKLAVSGQTFNPDEPLFEVKNNTGQTVFAVYNEGVRIYVDDGTAKGTKGGFAVGGFSSPKGSPEYFRVTSDSTRIYVYNNSAKGQKGGFAVGGDDGTEALSISLAPYNYLTSINDALLLKPQSDPPGSAMQGMMYFDSDDKKLKVFDGTEWRSLW